MKAAAKSGMGENEYQGFGPRFDKTDYSVDTLSRRGLSAVFKGKLRNVTNRNNLESKLLAAPETSLFTGWNEDLYGIPRIGVHGKDSICVLVRKEDVVSLMRQMRQVEDPARFCFKDERITMGEIEECWNDYFHHKLMNALIHEVEDLALKEPHKKFLRSDTPVSRPFFVVTGCGLSTDTVDHETSVYKGRHIEPSGHQASSDVCDMSSAYDCLLKEMNRMEPFTFTRTVKAAISALQHMFHKKFESHEIEVFYLRRGDGTTKVFSRTYDGKLREISKACAETVEMEKCRGVRDMPTLAERSVNDYLRLINKEI